MSTHKRPPADLRIASGGSDASAGSAPKAPEIALTVDSGGIVPLEFKVLVLPSDIEVDPAILSAKKAGIALPPDVMERELAAQMVATFISKGGNAFEDWHDAKTPGYGDRVLIAKYAGTTIVGADKREYRLLNDKDIAALITKEGVSRI